MSEKFNILENDVEFRFQLMPIRLDFRLRNCLKSNRRVERLGKEVSQWRRMYDLRTPRYGHG